MKEHFIHIKITNASKAAFISAIRNYDAQHNFRGGYYGSIYIRSINEVKECIANGYAVSFNLHADNGMFDRNIKGERRTATRNDMADIVSNLQTDISSDSEWIKTNGVDPYKALSLLIDELISAGAELEFIEQYDAIFICEAKQASLAIKRFATISLQEVDILLRCARVSAIEPHDQKPMFPCFNAGGYVHYVGSSEYKALRRLQGAKS
ncbi:MAG: hypothetical protein LBV04_05240 [Deferribacteraceae bacterium]|jgi:hypothetical protein|nr:hypothetical protein [Deferribacteraceae bacterium]